jgi:hypothetical protein
VFIAQVVEPCLGGAHVVIKFKLLGPKTSNVWIVNAETGMEIAEGLMLASLK